MSKIYKVFDKQWVRGEPWIPRQYERVILNYTGASGTKRIEGVIALVYENGSPDESRPSATMVDSKGVFWSGLMENYEPISTDTPPCLICGGVERHGSKCEGKLQ